MRLISSIVLAMVLAARAFATELPLPVFPDPNAACAADADRFYDRASDYRWRLMNNDCLEKAQAGYDVAQALWKDVPDKYASHCLYYGQTAAADKRSAPYAWSVFGQCVAEFSAYGYQAQPFTAR